MNHLNESAEWNRLHGPADCAAVQLDYLAREHCPAGPTPDAGPTPAVGLGRIVALYYHSLTSYQIHEHIRCLYI